MPQTLFVFSFNFQCHLTLHLRPSVPSAHWAKYRRHTYTTLYLLLPLLQHCLSPGNPLISSYTIFLQFFLGRQCFFFTPRFFVCNSSRDPALFHAIPCPIHCNRLFFMIFLSFAIVVLRLTYSFRMLSFQAIPSICLCHWWWISSKFYTSIGHKPSVSSI